MFSMFVNLLVRYHITIIFIITMSTAYQEQDWPCSKTRAIESFRGKTLLNPFPKFYRDPYTNQTSRSAAIVNRTLQDNNRVCGLAYGDNRQLTYTLKDFPSKNHAELEDHIVTHQGRCGVCSSTQDLAVYLSGNLTEPVRHCAMLNVISASLSRACLKRLGFSDRCADIWLFNSNYTRKRCFMVCMLSWAKREPFNKPDGSLNDCLECDETYSGPIFKYFSGRTRRNSGIVSAIQRPKDQFYNMTHCYF